MVVRFISHGIIDFYVVRGRGHLIWCVSYDTERIKERCWTINFLSTKPSFHAESTVYSSVII